MVSTKFSWVQALGEARKSVASSVGATLRTLREQLRTNKLQGFELEMLGRFLRDVPTCNDEAFPTLRVAIVSGFTSEPFANAARVALLAEGFCAEVYEAPFGVYRQEILSQNSELYAFKPNLLLLMAPAVDVSSMPTGPLVHDELEAALNREVDQWRTLWSELIKRTSAIVLQHTFDIPDTTILGIAERRAPWSPARFIAELNGRMIEAAPGAVHWVDVDHLSALVGRQNWHDPRLKFHGKLAFSSRYLPEYNNLLGGALRSALGRTRKALIVDLDNTLWGGVIGDDGLDGIHLGPDTPLGEAYQAFCRYIGDLGRRGVILGICSKNELANVTEVFEKHQHMPLSLDAFAVIRCNWNDKASNLEAIALELNIDVSALVFVDDNPAECELIRQVLPSVHVIQLDDDPAFFVRRLDSERLFDSQRLSVEDIKRTDSYQAKVKFESMRAVASDLNTYLASLEMVGDIGLAKQEELPRIAQMELKTNQFNLSTRRLRQEQIETLMDKPSYTILAIYLRDKLADHGLVAYVIFECVENVLVVTDWLMSCRVFSRTLEHFILNYIVEMAEAKNIATIRLNYKPTQKNKMMTTVFENLGFSENELCGGWVYIIGTTYLPRMFITYKANNQIATGLVLNGIH